MTRETDLDYEIVIKWNGEIIRVKLEEGADDDGAVPSDTESDETWKTSEAFFDTDGNSASPEIEITHPNIKVEHKVVGVGRIVDSWLKNSEASYVFKVSENRTVTPGTYEHNIWGPLSGRVWGKLTSKITYK